MSSKIHTDQVYNSKKKDIKFNIQLNEEQKIVKSLILDNTIVLVSGAMGSGKTLTVVQTGLDMLFNKKVDRIVISRPLVTADEELGFLPGSIKEKTDPFLRPIYEMIGTVYNKASIEKMIADKTIDVIPLAYMRGLNLDKSFVILDEAQNCTINQLKLIMGRLCIDSKLAICGDINQIDLKKPSTSAFHSMYKLNDIPGYAKYNLITNHRHPIVELMLDALN